MTRTRSTHDASTGSRKAGWIPLAALACAIAAGCAAARSPVTPATQALQAASETAGRAAPATAAATASVGASGGAAPRKLAPVSAAIVLHGPRDSRRVAITFDLCERATETAGFEPRIPGILDRYKAKATFFMGGKWASSHPGAAKRLASDALFEIGNHSWTHPYMNRLSKSQQTAQVTDAQEQIARLTGVTPTVFRFPYGEYDQASLESVAGQGLRSIQWDVVTGDPDKNISASDIVGAVERAKPGAIVIMHANGRGWNTPEALPGVIETLRDKGYELVTVSELLGPSTGR